MDKVIINREKNEVILRFDNRLYSKEYIDQAIKEFSEICDSREEKENLVLIPKDISDLDRLGFEFYNYVFGLVKNSAGSLEKATGSTTSPKNYLLNHYREKKICDKHLITTDHGTWVLLDDAQYNSYKNNNLSKEIFPLLKEKGLIVTETNLDIIVSEYRKKYSFIFQGTSLHIVIPTLRCNQKCIYCHANSKPLDAEGYDMDEETAKKTVDLIFQTPSPSITIEFQGGEPLLRPDLVRYIISYAKEKNETYKKNLNFRLVTNLVNLTDDALEFLTKEKVGLCTSLDGCEFVHNKNRGMYSEVANWISKIKRSHNLNAMMLVTKHSLPYFKEIIDEYAKQGFDNIWIKPVNELGYAAKNKSEAICTSEEFLDFWKKSLEYLLEINKTTLLRENFSMIILKKILKNEDTHYTELQSPCGAAISQLAYNYDGSVYTCDEGRQYDIFKIGTVDNTYPELLTSPDTCGVVIASLTDSLVCDTCVYKPYCGVCPVCSYAETNNIIPRFPNRRCTIMKGMFDFIFEKLSENNEYKQMFLKWLE